MGNDWKMHSIPVNVLRKFQVSNRNSVKRNYAELRGIVWNCAELCGIARNCVELRGIVWNCLELCGIARNNLSRPKIKQIVLELLNFFILFIYFL